MKWKREKLRKGKMQKKELLEYLLINEGVVVAQVWPGCGGHEWFWIVTGEGGLDRLTSPLKYKSLIEAQRSCEKHVEESLCQ